MIRPAHRLLPLLLAGACVTACASGVGGTRAASDHLVGVHWRLAQVAARSGRPVTVPPTLESYLDFTRGYAVTGRDGCSAVQGQGHRRPGSIELTDADFAANGCLSDHGPLDLTRNAVGALFTGRPVTVDVSADRLLLRAGGYTLRYVYGGGYTPSPGPVSTTPSMSA